MSVHSLNKFKYVFGINAEPYCERLYRTDDGLYMQILTRKYKSGKFGKQKIRYGRVPPGKKQIKWFSHEKQKTGEV